MVSHFKSQDIVGGLPTFRTVEHALAPKFTMNIFKVVLSSSVVFIVLKIVLMRSDIGCEQTAS